jgi:hypothetical protein
MVKHHFWRALVVVCGLVVLAAAAASAGPGAAGENVKVSGTSPFAACTADDVPGQIGTNFLHSEVEPWIEVSSVDRSGDGVADRIGAYQQDRWSNGGARGIVASVFHAGAWQQVVIPGVSTCSGGAFHRATDPWVAIAPNGDAYVQNPDVPGLSDLQHVDHLRQQVDEWRAYMGAADPARPQRLSLPVQR